jgi:hypothetical protein
MEKLPSPIEAEKWLDPDTFMVKGKIYRIEEPDFTIKEIGKEDKNDHCRAKGNC